MTDSGSTYDLIVIGAGPGGYVAAIRAAQLGMRVACVDRRAALGGTCLNVGCIPSKALLHSSELYEDARKNFAGHGIKVAPELDLPVMLARKDKTVDALTKGIGFLFKKNKIARLTGSATIAAPGKVSITDGPDKGKALSAPNVLIATGSESTSLPALPVDGKRVITSTEALSLSAVPEHMVVVGGGVIGLELGSVWRRLGARVTVVEYLDRILPGMDGEISKTALRILKKQGMSFALKTKVTDAKARKKGLLSLTLAPAEGDGERTLDCDVALVCVGRRPHTEGLGLDALGVARDGRGFITVDENFSTNVSGIYAIGDCAPGPMLAHKAEDEGVVCVERMAGMKPHLDYGVIPGVVYTHPEIASVGATEEELRERNIPHKIGTFPVMVNSRARAAGATDGMVKLLAHAETDQLLGAHIISHGAGELIHELAMVLEFGGSAEDVARMCHAHPTFSEAIREAALATQDGAIHA